MGRDGARPTRAGTPAPQCGTGDLARQIAENGLEIGQTPGTGRSPSLSTVNEWSETTIGADRPKKSLKPAKVHSSLLILYLYIEK